MESLTLQERLEFARIITPEVLSDTDDEMLQANIDAGYNLVNAKASQVGADNVRMIYYWLEVYEDERDRRAASRAGPGA